MKTLPADTLVCACEALFRVKLLLWPPVHHNLIRLHIFPPLPQRSRLLTPELISKEDLLFSRQLLCSEDTASAVIYAQVHNITLLYLYCKNTSVSRSFLHPLVFPKSSEIVIEVPAAVAQHSPLVYSLHSPRRLVLLSWLYEDSLFQACVKLPNNSSACDFTSLESRSQSFNTFDSL